MAVKNVRSSFHVPTTFKQTVLFIGYYLLLFIDPLVIIRATSMAPCCCYVVYMGRGCVLNGRGLCNPSMCLLPWIEIIFSNMCNLRSDFKVETYLFVLTCNDTDENCNLLRFV